MQSDSVLLKGGEHAVLLVHGLSASPREVSFLAKVLNMHGFTVFAPTFPGYSFGQGHADAKTKWTDWLNAIRARYVELESQYKSVCVGGLSMGATLTLALAAQERTITAISLLSTTLEYDGWSIPWYNFLLDFAYFTPLRRFYRFKEGEPYGLKNRQLRRKIARAMSSAAFSDVGPSSLSLDNLYQARRLSKYLAYSAPLVTTDTLVIHAVDDDTASPKAADFVIRNVASAHKRKILLDNSYHIITMDNERELVARETALFFKESVKRKYQQDSGQGPQMLSKQLARARKLAELGEP